MSKEKRLGRGLEALLGRIPSAPEPAAPASGPTAQRSAENPYGPRADDPYGLSVPLYNPPTKASAQAPVHGEPTLAQREATLAQREAALSQREAAEPAEPADMFQPAAPLPAAPQPSAPQHAASEPFEAPPASQPRVAIDLIDSNPYQPRQEFNQDDLHSLAESLAAHGLLQPVVVRRIDDRYELVAGERRLRAASLAGWTDVPAQIVEADDRQMAELAIVENMQRKDLNPLEKAACFHRYLEQYGCTQEELAGRLKLDRSTVANLIRLLELPEAVQDALRKGRLTQGHARALLPLGEEQEQVAFCQRIQREGLSVRQTEALVQETIQRADSEPLGLLGRDGEKTKPRRVQNDHLASLEQEFRAALGVKVVIRQGRGGRGKLLIHFRTHDEFDRLRDHICAQARPEAKAG